MAGSRLHGEHKWLLRAVSYIPVCYGTEEYNPQPREEIIPIEPNYLPTLPEGLGLAFLLGIFLSISTAILEEILWR